MYRFLPILAFFLLLGLSCRTNHQSRASSKDGDEPLFSAGTEQQVAGKDTFAFLVSFFSRGEGIDLAMRNALDKYIDDYQARNKTDLKVEKYPWGREGEIDYCFPLKDFKEKERKNFTDGVHELLQASKLVHFSENTPCIHKR